MQSCRATHGAGGVGTVHYPSVRRDPRDTSEARYPERVCELPKTTQQAGSGPCLAQPGPRRGVWRGVAGEGWLSSYGFGGV